LAGIAKNLANRPRKLAAPTDAKFEKVMTLEIS
jgi:hypothetical protein